MLNNHYAVGPVTSQWRAGHNDQTCSTVFKKLQSSVRPQVLEQLMVEVKRFQRVNELLNVLRFPGLSCGVCTNVQANRSSGKKTNTCNGYTHGSDCWDRRWLESSAPTNAKSCGWVGRYNSPAKRHKGLSRTLREVESNSLDIFRKRINI